MTSVVVGTRDFRHALRSVVPLAGTLKGPGAERWNRVRIDIPASGPLIVSASDAWCSGMARVNDWEGDHRSPATLDLTTTQVRSVLEVFKAAPKKDDIDTDGESMIKIDVLDNAFEFTDVSGLPGIDGRHFGEPRLEVDLMFTDVPHLISRLADAPERVLPQFVAAAGHIVDFKPAATAYGEYLRVTAHEGWDNNYGVHVGKAFSGVLYAPRPSEGERAEWAVAKQEWADLLPDPRSTPRDTVTTDEGTKA